MLHEKTGGAYPICAYPINFDRSVLPPDAFGNIDSVQAPFSEIQMEENQARSGIVCCKSHQLSPCLHSGGHLRSASLLLNNALNFLRSQAQDKRVVA